MTEASIPQLPTRPSDGHKGTFGTVVVVGGSPEMIGAPALAASAALRTGCGLVKIATDPAILPHCITIEPGATGLSLDPRDDPMRALEGRLGHDDVLAVGPGIGVGDREARLVNNLLRQGRPVVLDADGLNNLAQMHGATVLAHCPLVLTPHPGEAARLAEAARLRIDPLDPSQRPDAAQQLADAFGAVVLLKGTGTVISDGTQTHINTTGNVALATAGSGDILTGMIASLIAQGSTPYDAAVLGAYLHGLIGNIHAEVVGPTGLSAVNMLALISAALSRHMPKS